MKQSSIRLIVLSMLVVVAAGVWLYAGMGMDSKQQPQEPSDDQSKETQKPERTAEPTGKYVDLRGDAFDEAYLADMLAHNEGAVNMAEQAQAVTSRDEIRTLAADITYEQSVEMGKIIEWQNAWGYEATMGQGHNSQTGEGSQIAGDMVEMQNKLKGLKGEAYDREFLRQMILHHQQAIEMAENAERNAGHQEVKDFAQSITQDYTDEIIQMRQWQAAWGF